MGEVGCKLSKEQEISIQCTELDKDCAFIGRKHGGILYWALSMGRNLILLILATALCFYLTITPTQAEQVFFAPQLSGYAGKSYTGVQDPEYINYSSALQEYMVKRIHQQYGIALDPKTFSVFDLLEIESLLKCKKPEEPAGLFLKMFPKYR